MLKGALPPLSYHRLGQAFPRRRAREPYPFARRRRTVPETFATDAVAFNLEGATGLAATLEGAPNDAYGIEGAPNSTWDLDGV